MIVPNFLRDVSFPPKLDLDNYAQITHPIITINFKNSEYVVDGFKRINSKLEYGVANIGGCNSLEDMIIYYVKLNSFRGLNIFEISKLFVNINKYFNDVKLIEKICSLLNLKFSKKLIDDYIKLDNLIFEGRTLFIKGRLNKNIALKLAGLAEKEQKIFLKIINNLRLNGNKQKKLFEMITDLAGREGVKPSNIFRKYFSKFLYEEYSKQLEEDFFYKLMILHSPNYYKFMNNFATVKSKILKDIKGINLISPTNFEEEQLKLEIYFSSFNELKNKLKKLETNLDKKY